MAHAGRYWHAVGKLGRQGDVDARTGELCALKAREYTQALGGRPVMDGRWLAFAAVATLAAASSASSKGSLGRPRFGKRLDLTTDRPLPLKEARKLKRWWEGHGWSVELFKKPRGLFGVVATKVEFK